jgi:hypothetical protein
MRQRDQGSAAPAATAEEVADLKEEVARLRAAIALKQAREDVDEFSRSSTSSRSRACAPEPAPPPVATGWALPPVAGCVDDTRARPPLSFPRTCLARHLARRRSEHATFSYQRRLP